MRAPQEVREMVRAAIATSATPDSKVIALDVMPQLSEEQRDYMALVGVEGLIGQEFHQLRADQATAQRAKRVEGVSWLKRARLTLDGLGIQITVGGVSRWVEDCTWDEIELWATEQYATGRAFTEKGDQAMRYANAGRAAGTRTVREWDALGRPDDLGMAA